MLENNKKQYEVFKIIESQKNKENEFTFLHR